MLLAKWDKKDRGPSLSKPFGAVLIKNPYGLTIVIGEVLPCYVMKKSPRPAVSMQSLLAHGLSDGFTAGLNHPIRF